MSKNTYFTGQPLYAQLLKLIDKSKINQISKKNGYDYYTKKLDGYTHFVIFLFAILMRYDSLREVVLGMLSESNKLQHLGINYMAKRSTLSEANNRRDSEFFAKIYSSLYKHYRLFLADSCPNKRWEKALYIMDSTTITLFSNILKGVGRNPKHGKKKGGIKAHTVIKATENVPCLIRYTSAATHDHFLLKELHLEKGSFIAIDRAYIDYSEFQRFTDEEVYYVTKMKRNLTYKTIKSTYYVTSDGLVSYYESIILLKNKKVKHKARRIEYWKIDKKVPTILLTNNFEMETEEIIAIYDRRWQIELLFKQLKQNFPLKYFYGDSVNAIKSQIWVTLIANLLLTVVRKRVKRKWSFSNMTSMVRQMLMYYIDLYKYLENPEKAWLEKNAKSGKSPPLQLSLFE